jgi:hypothetical protein
MTLASREWQLTWPPETLYKQLSVKFRIELLHCLCEEQTLSNPMLRELAFQWAESERGGIQHAWSGPDSAGCYHILIKDRLGTFRLYQRCADGMVGILCTSFAEISRFTRCLIRLAVAHPQYTHTQIPRLYRNLFDDVSQLERLIDRSVEGVVNSLIDQVCCSGYKADRSLRLASSSSVCTFCRTAIDSTITKISVDGADEEVALVATAVEDGEDTLVAAGWLDGFGDDPPLVPLRSLSNFDICDECDHLVNMEEGMLECGVRLFISGQVGALADQSSSACICTSKLEILVWEVIFYDDDTGRESEGSAGVAICTDAAEYVLLTPSEDYSPFFVALKVPLLLLHHVSHHHISHHQVCSHSRSARSHCVDMLHATQRAITT